MHRGACRAACAPVLEHPDAGVGGAGSDLTLVLVGAHHSRRSTLAVAFLHFDFLTAVFARSGSISSLSRV